MFLYCDATGAYRAHSSIQHTHDMDLIALRTVVEDLQIYLGQSGDLGALPHLPSQNDRPSEGNSRAIKQRE